MPRKKHVSPFGNSETNIHHRIARAAHLFTQEILHILGSSTLEDLTALSHGESGARFPAPMAIQPPPRRRSLEFLKDIGKIPVPCPMPGCQARGIRSKMNFCMEHAASVPKAEQVRMREAQKAGKLPEEEAPRRLPPKMMQKASKRPAPLQPSA